MLITPADYRRIYSTIHSLLLADSVDSHEASMLFSVYGAQILKRHFGIPAQPMAGAAAYHLGLQAKILTFGAYQAGTLQSSIVNITGGLRLMDGCLILWHPYFQY